MAGKRYFVFESQRLNKTRSVQFNVIRSTYPSLNIRLLKISMSSLRWRSRASFGIA